MKLEDAIANAYPMGLSYDDAAQLCLQIYRTLDDIPQQLIEEPLTKNRIAEMFSSLNRRGVILRSTCDTSVMYGTNLHDRNDKGHWIEIIASIFKIDNTVKMDRGAELIKPLIILCAG